VYLRTCAYQPYSKVPLSWSTCDTCIVTERDPSVSLSVSSFLPTLPRRIICMGNTGAVADTFCLSTELLGGFYMNINRGMFHIALCDFFIGGTFIVVQ